MCYHFCDCCEWLIHSLMCHVRPIGSGPVGTSLRPLFISNTYFCLCNHQPSLHPDQSCWRRWSWMVLWRPTKPSKTNIPKRYSFHYRGQEFKNRSQEIPGVRGEFGLGVQNEAGQKLIEFCQENALFIENTFFQQHKRRLYTWHHQMVNTGIRLIIFFAAKDWEALFSH